MSNYTKIFCFRIYIYIITIWYSNLPTDILTHHTMVLFNSFLLCNIFGKVYLTRDISYQMQMIWKKRKNHWHLGSWNYIANLKLQLFKSYGFGTSRVSGGPINNSVSTSVICRSSNSCSFLVDERSSCCIPHCKISYQTKLLPP